MKKMNGDNSLIVKKILHTGTKEISFKNGTKVRFHFLTRMCNDEKTILDDTRKMGEGKPFELIIGKKFKLEVFEAIVQQMALKEVAQFSVNQNLIMQYPFVSKTIRDQFVPPEKRKATHCCAMTLQTEGVGYDDLNKFLKDPTDLEFTIDLVEVIQPEDYEKETWQLNESELLTLIPKLRIDGNDLFKAGNYLEAEKMYSKAIGILEQLMLKEKPRDIEWNNLNKQKIPLLLNYSQCKLNHHDYYSVIEHCTTVLESEPDNVKALFRRGRAHVGAWNPEKAKEDLNQVIKLDPTLTGAVTKELQLLSKQIAIKNKEDKNKLQKLFTT